jgi:hypothetical protein
LVGGLLAGHHRAAELVVDARSEEIDVLFDMVGNEEAGGRNDSLLPMNW